MSNVTNELMFELLKSIHAGVDDVKQDMRDLKIRMTATEEAVVGVHRRLDRHEDRLERIERRLELREMAEPPQRPFDPPSGL